MAGAATLFQAEGYGNTSMAGIAEISGLAKPSRYHYFASKDEILFAIHDEFIDCLIDQRDQRSAALLSPKAELREVFGDIFDLMDTHRGHVRPFFEHHWEMPEQQQQLIRAKRDDYESWVQGLIERGSATGAFRQVDAKLVTLALFGMANWAYQWLRSGDLLASQEIATHFWDFLILGISASVGMEDGIASTDVLSVQ